MFCGICPVAKILRKTAFPCKISLLLSYGQYMIFNMAAVCHLEFLPQICEILRFCDFFIVLSWLYFVLGIVPRLHPGRILTVCGLNDASSPKDVPFGDLMTTHNFKGFKPTKKPPKGGMVRQTGKIIKSQYLRWQRSDSHQILTG